MSYPPQQGYPPQGYPPQGYPPPPPQQQYMAGPPPGYGTPPPPGYPGYPQATYAGQPPPQYGGVVYNQAQVMPAQPQSTVVVIQGQGGGNGYCNTCHNNTNFQMLQEPGPMTFFCCVLWCFIAGPFGLLAFCLCPENKVVCTNCGARQG